VALMYSVMHVLKLPFLFCCVINNLLFAYRLKTVKVNYNIQIFISHRFITYILLLQYCIVCIYSMCSVLMNSVHVVPRVVDTLLYVAMESVVIRFCFTHSAATNSSFYGP